MAEIKLKNKILTPKIPKDLESLIIDEDIQDNEVYENGIIAECSFEYNNAERPTFDVIIFKNVCFKDARFSGIELTDVRFENCDLSNADFSGAVIHRSEFINCKMVGLNLSEATIRNVMFNQCHGRYSSFRFVDFKQVNFIDCFLDSGDFQKCELSKVVFLTSSLRQVEFSGTNLKGIDLTNCDIEGIGARIEDLNGVIVSAIQAVSLCRIMGVVVK